MSKLFRQSSGDDARSAEGAGPAARVRHSRPWILVALMCTMMLAAMDTTIVSTAIPQIVADLGGFSLFSWVFSIYLLAQTVTIPVYGKLSDLFGRKRILLVGTIIFLIGSAASAAADSMLVLVVCRGVQGLGAGSIMATVSTLAGDLYDVRERAAVQGWLSSVWGMAAVVGPVLGGALAQYTSWRWIFLINLPIGIAAMGLLGVFLHEEFERRKPRVDYGGATLILLAAGALIVGLLQGGQAWAWLSAPSLIIFATFLGAVAWLVRTERRAADPIMPGKLWTQRALGGANFATVAMGIVMMAPEAYLPIFGQSVLGLGAIASGFILASMSLGWPVASALSGRMYMRFGFRQAALAGGGLIILSMAGFAMMPRPASAVLVTLDTIVLGAGFGLLSTPLLVGMQSAVGWNERGMVTGSNMFARYLGQSLGAALFGTLFNASLRQHLMAAPGSITKSLPRDINQVIGALQDHRLPEAAASYLRQGIDTATVHLYIAATLVSVLLLIAVWVIPRSFGPTT